MSEIYKGELFRAFFEEVSEGLFALNLRDSTIIAANQALFQLTGRSPDELVGESLTTLSSQPLPAELKRERRLDLEVIKTEGTHSDIVVPHKEGPPRFTSVRVRHFKNSNSEDAIALVAIIDDTERQWLIRDLAAKHQALESAYQDLSRAHEELKISQDQMARTARLSALGELAAGLSHELGQPLTGIVGFSQEIGDILKTQAKPKKFEIFKLAQTIEKQAKRMALLLSQFRQFARDEKKIETGSSLEKFKLSEVFESVLNLLSKQLEKRGIKVKVESKNETFECKGRHQPLEQILINLVSNSRDALKNNPSGLIEVTLESKPNEFWVRVSDNGQGIEEKYQSKIFDPFFTTKDPGAGTGLGLSISYALAQKMGGSLSLEKSIKGVGTTFLWKIPKVFNSSKKQSENDLEFKTRRAS